MTLCRINLLLNKVLSCFNIKQLNTFSYVVLYSFGDFPVIRLKYLPKTDCEGKLRWSLICWMSYLLREAGL